jgi:hypothetical protein
MRDLRFCFAIALTTSCIINTACGPSEAEIREQCMTNAEVAASAVKFNEGDSSAREQSIELWYQSCLESKGISQ